MEARSWATALLLALLVYMLGGCAAGPAAPPSIQPVDDPVARPAETDQLHWWYVRFRMQWPEGEDPPWYPDLWLADRLLGPVLEAENESIALWRFHRRAARDGAGRQFSFIFRATPATADRVNQRIRSDPLPGEMQRLGILAEVVFDDPAAPSRPGIADTSDAAWSPEMQRAWPHYIMGVSRLWLELIRELQREGDWPPEPAERYAAIAATVDGRWRDEGSHALLHHLNAVFGYREVQVLRRELLRF
ncbi:hypothetical protein [Thioalkalivibrio paradoxus]|uniref:Uncharacterized protein n=1 Tax=Thioalkalivibrio paradoxus ARh 1 TaxID=713585 RepID=W0DJ85_9GAMM|nr:hypothetical protein [Thioalkalivibrio paradoxus]AHE96945.1 hypothetical protein THITH_00160 [Thioalkalivibrio paradoxus ARh 1]